MAEKNFEIKRHGNEIWLEADDLTHEEMEAIANNPYPQDAEENETTYKIDKQLDELQKEAEKSSVVYYPQDAEENEFRYFIPQWLDEIARGLTKGAVKHPGETWRKIPAREHAWRAVRHLILYLNGDKQDKHLINASMRCMMCFETDAAANSTIEWEKLMREKGCG